MSVEAWVVTGWNIKRGIYTYVSRAPCGCYRSTFEIVRVASVSFRVSFLDLLAPPSHSSQVKRRREANITLQNLLINTSCIYTI